MIRRKCKPRIVQKKKKLTNGCQINYDSISGRGDVMSTFFKGYKKEVRPDFGRNTAISRLQ